MLPFGAANWTVSKSAMQQALNLLQTGSTPVRFTMEHEVEYCNVPLKKNHLADFQELLKKYKSVRFLSNPVFNSHEEGCVRISYGGNGDEMNALGRETQEASWDWETPKPIKKKWWRH